ncbi:MAG: universal stress protein [Dehalococcoidia bacterium]
MRVLVALDGSPLSEQALEGIAALEPMNTDEIVLVTVLNAADIHETWRESPVATADTPRVVPIGQVPPISVHGPGAAVEDRNQALERARTEATEYLEGQRNRVLAGVPARVVVAWADSPAEGIVELAQREGAGLVLLGTHGRTGLTRLLMGSVAEQVLRTSPVPVVLMRAGMAPPPP